MWCENTENYSKTKYKIAKSLIHQHKVINCNIAKKSV